MPRTKNDVADIVESAARAFLSEGFPGTAEVIRHFRKLGKDLGYTVAPSGCETGYRGWLYDLAWFDEDEDSLFVRMPLIIESENRPDPHIDPDFQKLVQARADVRLWIAILPTPQPVEMHVRLCKEQIARFDGTLPGDIYILAIYGSHTPQAYFERIISN